MEDRFDACPDLFGKKELKGCPFADADKDGVRDEDDACPAIAGDPSNKGCPLPDRDDDGVLDYRDKCPDTPGLSSSQGCPEIDSLERALLANWNRNLNFDSQNQLGSSSEKFTFEMFDVLKSVRI